MVPYEVACLCGRVVRGRRRLRHQSASCPACGRLVFVLPVGSWFTQPATRPRESAEGEASAVSAPSPWRMPLMAAAATLAVVLALFLASLPFLHRPRSDPGVPVADARSLIHSGQRALAEGNFQLAVQELSGALRQPDRLGGLTAAEGRELDQLYRQADLLARLSSRSLQELLLEALPLRRAEEWQARFRDHHRGDSIVFDDVVRRDRAGRPSLASYIVRAGDETARVALEDLELLRKLPDEPRRIVFGGRLADLTRVQGGGWVVRFEPGSGVLLTEPGAVATCLGPLEPELAEVLRRQRQWLDGLDLPRPVPGS